MKNCIQLFRLLLTLILFIVGTSMTLINDAFSPPQNDMFLLGTKIDADNLANCLDCAYSNWETSETEGKERVSWVGRNTEIIRKLRRKNKCVRIQLTARFDTVNNSHGEFVLVIERGKQIKQQTGSNKGAIAADIDYFFYLSEDDTNDEVKIYAKDLRGGIDLKAPANYCEFTISYANPN